MLCIAKFGDGYRDVGDAVWRSPPDGSIRTGCSIRKVARVGLDQFGRMPPELVADLDHVSSPDQLWMAASDRPAVFSSGTADCGGHPGGELDVLYVP